MLLEAAADNAVDLLGGLANNFTSGNPAFFFSGGVPVDVDKLIGADDFNYKDGVVYSVIDTAQELLLILQLRLGLFAGRDVAKDSAGCNGFTRFIAAVNTAFN